MGKPWPAAKVIEFRPASPAAWEKTRSHVVVHPRTTTTVSEAVVAGADGPFDWARDLDHSLDQQHPVRALGPVLPTLVACALDRVGQHLDDPTRVSKADAFEALRLIRAHFRPEVI